VLVVDLDLEALGLLGVALFVVGEIVYGLRWLRQTPPPRPPREAGA
jgi:hypothetical protein